MPFAFRFSCVYLYASLSRSRVFLVRVFAARLTIPRSVLTWPFDVQVIIKRLPLIGLERQQQQQRHRLESHSMNCLCMESLISVAAKTRNDCEIRDGPTPVQPAM